MYTSSIHQYLIPSFQSNTHCLARSFLTQEDVLAAILSTFWMRSSQCLHWTESVCNRWETGADRPHVYTEPGGSGTDQKCYLVPYGSTCEGYPTWNRTVPVSSRSRVNRIVPQRSGSDPKQIFTYSIPRKRNPGPASDLLSRNM